MERRTFITLVGGATAWPLAARAQQPAKMKRLAIVRPSGSNEDVVASKIPFRPLFEELSRLGYVEGKNLAIEKVLC